MSSLMTASGGSAADGTYDYKAPAAKGQPAEMLEEVVFGIGLLQQMGC